MGKPLRDAVAEVEKCALLCRYYADHAERQLAPQPVSIPGSSAQAYVAFEPLGVILAVMPWNYPFWQAFRFLVPALMAGNGGILKHAPNVPGCADAIESVFHEAGVPVDLLRSVRVGHDAVRRIIHHPVIQAVSLTGSGRAGRVVAAEAGSALKKTLLELGGSDPFIVLDDADLDHAVQCGMTSRLMNAGQSCIAAKRFFLTPGIADAFEARLLEAMASAAWGDPMDPSTRIGPLAREDLRDALHAQVRESIAQGATCLLGGEIPDSAGWFYPPTVLSDVRPGMPAFEEELFGPVAALIRVRDADEAIAWANRSRYGLGASVFTQDRARGEELAHRELEAGLCFVNAVIRSDPRLPFGGVKESGYGRELAEFGIREFVNVKTVWVE
jgi:succinate-semialdehyde dehydrogenase / glutarate-semialdehyde dehydrogenase